MASDDTASIAQSDRSRKQGAAISEDPASPFPTAAELDASASSVATRVTSSQLVRREYSAVLLEKLDERRASAREAMRLCAALGRRVKSLPYAVQGLSLPELRQIRGEEGAHVELLTEALKALGGAPADRSSTVSIPAEEFVAAGQIVSARETSLDDALYAALLAKFVDVEAWEHIVSLAELGDVDRVHTMRFRNALAQARNHLRKLRSSYQQLVANSGDRA